jgi:hypothetical protein
VVAVEIQAEQVRCGSSPVAGIVEQVQGGGGARAGVIEGELPKAASSKAAQWWRRSVSDRCGVRVVKAAYPASLSSISAEVCASVAASSATQSTVIVPVMPLMCAVANPSVAHSKALATGETGFSPRCWVSR